MRSNKIYLGLLLVISSLLNAQETSFIIDKFESKARISSNPIGYNGNLYFGNDNGVFLCIDGATLKEKWSVKTATIIRSKPIVNQNIVYFKSGYSVYALSTKTGEELWRHTRPSNANWKPKDLWDYHSGVPVILKNTLYVGFEDGIILGFNLKSGATETEIYADDSAAIKSGLYIHDAILYYGDWNGKIYAYDLRSNKRLWKYDTYEKQEYPTFGQVNTELIVHKGLLFFGARNPELQVLDIKSGQKKWNFIEKKGGWISGDPLIHNDTLFISGSDNHKLIAFNPINGNRYWEYKFLFNSFSKSIIYKHFILITSGDAYSVYGNGNGFGYLYALNRKNGNIINYARIGGNLNSTPVLEKDYLFLCNEDGNLYKIDLNNFISEPRTLQEKGYQAFDIEDIDYQPDTTSVQINYMIHYTTKVKILITDLSGNEVKSLQNSLKKEGKQTIVWNCDNNDNTKVQPGYYFVQISSGDYLMKMPIEVK